MSLAKGLIGNLYGVDIMESAIGICKLCRGLTLAAEVDEVEPAEPLPNTGFTGTTKTSGPRSTRAWSTR